MSATVLNRIGKNRLGSRLSPSGALSARGTSPRDNQLLRGGGALLRFRCFERVGRKAPGPEDDTVTPAGDQYDEHRWSDDAVKLRRPNSTNGAIS